MIEIFPPELIDRYRLGDVIEFLKKLDVAPRLKKEALISWHKAVNVQLSREKIVELLGEDIDRVL